MTKPIKHGNTYRVYVQRSDLRWQRITTGTSDRRTAVAIGDMVDTLRARRDWLILDAVCKRDLTLGQVWDAYRVDQQLDHFHATLNDLDLEPLVAEWKSYLKARPIASATRYVR